MKTSRTVAGDECVDVAGKSINRQAWQATVYAAALLYSNMPYKCGG
ncbi:MAG: hypothetical protein GKS00_28875 [Alphaproteobacteria bacterium]|nr:hypothetical protein [Alphaproteobacteria bacterium]